MIKRGWGLVGWILGGVAGLIVISYAGSTTMAIEAYDRSLMASWMQAVGSVGAILGAIWAVVHQNEVADSGRRDGVLGVIEAAQVRAAEFAKALEAENGRIALMKVYHPAVIASVQGALASVPAQAIQSKDGVLALFSLQTQFSIVTMVIDAFLRGAPDAPPTTLEIYSAQAYQAREDKHAAQVRILAHIVRGHLTQIESDCELLTRALQ